MYDQDKEKKGLNDEEMENLKNMIGDLFSSIDWDNIPDDDEDEDESED